MNPLYGTIFNFVLAIGGLSETTGLTNALQSYGGKAGAVALLVFSAINTFSHAYSSAKPGPLSSDTAAQTVGQRPRT